jgi:hypothetical protein
LIGNPGQGDDSDSTITPIAPYSLGKLIDWKPLRSFDCGVVAGSPYSLGKLIDWKQASRLVLVTVIVIQTPYSLGKLIDWKHYTYRTLGAIPSISLLAREIN